MHFCGPHPGLVLLLINLTPVLAIWDKPQPTVPEPNPMQPWPYAKGYLGAGEYCPASEREGKHLRYCEVKFEEDNKTMNAKVDAKTTTPSLAFSTWSLDKLPVPLLPVGSVRNGASDDGLTFSQKAELETLYTLAMNTSVMDKAKNAMYTEDEEKDWQDCKTSYWRWMWCKAYSSQCVSSDMKSGGKDMGKWDIGILEKVFKKRMDKKGLIVRGERIQELLSFPENADIKNQCVKTVHHPGDKCNKKGEKCKVGEWDQDTIECQINCGDKACLRVADGNFVG